MVGALAVCLQDIIITGNLNAILYVDTNTFPAKTLPLIVCKGTRGPNKSIVPRPLLDNPAYAGVVAGGDDRPYRDPDIILVTEDPEEGAATRQAAYAGSPTDKLQNILNGRRVKIASWDVAVTTSAALSERVQSKQNEMNACHEVLVRSNPEATVESIAAVLTIDGIISKNCTDALWKLGASGSQMALIAASAASSASKTPTSQASKHRRLAYATLIDERERTTLMIKVNN